MIKVFDETPFQGNNASGFESSMFVTADKHISKHKNLNDMEILIINCGSVKSYNGATSDMENISFREHAQTVANLELADKKHIDIKTDASRLSMLLVYAGTADDKKQFGDPMYEYNQVKQGLIEFSRRYKKSLIACSHFHQMSSKGQFMEPPHVHIIYDSDGKSAKLDEYLRSYLSGFNTDSDNNRKSNNGGIPDFV